ncbi:MAG TPA: 30S ribosomal protein S17 [Patescibacteria group bacterium]|nr:30S ribosomal protein S17 [Patescibacteria group bacterium]
MNHRRHQGVVTRTAMKSTAVVRVDRQVAHEKYGKYFVVSKKYKIHDPKSEAHVGDVVEFEECRPISREKRWRYISTVKKAA